MRTLLHISDLHFGRTDCVLVRDLIDFAHKLKPDLLVVSGDLTQRARPVEFVEARAFLDAMPTPRIVTPGNHDIALYDLYGRFVEGLARYRRYISEVVDPHYEDPEMVVTTINTARSLTFKGGRVNPRQIEQVRARFQTAPAGVLKVLVGHHPIDLPAGMTQAVAGRARTALQVLSRCAIDLILSGHLHLSRISGPADELRIGGHSALLVQAGTAVSTRVRGEPNSFNVIRAGAEQIRIEQWRRPADSSRFDVCRTERFDRSAAGWVRLPPPTP